MTIYSYFVLEGRDACSRMTSSFDSRVDRMIVDVKSNIVGFRVSETEVLWDLNSDTYLSLCSFDPVLVMYRIGRLISL